jgi:hypothetical protein
MPWCLLPDLRYPLPLPTYPMLLPSAPGRSRVLRDDAPRYARQCHDCGWGTRRRLRPKAGRSAAAPRALSAQGPQLGLRRDSLLRLRRAVRPDHRRPPPPRGRRLAPARESQRGGATDQRACWRRPDPRHQPDRDSAEQQPIATARRPPVMRGRPIDRSVCVSESEGLLDISRCAVFRRTVMA